MRFEEKNFNLILWCIAGTALLLRAWGMDFGLPLLLHPDEPLYVNPAMRFGSGNLNPHWFGNPGNDLMYILFIAFLGYYFAGRLCGWFSGAEAFGNHFFSDPTIFYLLGRSVGVLAGALSVVAIGHLGKRLINERVGLVAALFLAVEPLSVEHAKYIRVDILGTLFVILAVLYALKFLDTRQKKTAIFASLAVGLAAATKYPFATVGVVILILTFYFLREPSAQFSWWKFSAVHCLLALAAFAGSTPFYFLDFQKAWHDLINEARGAHLGHESLPLLSNYWWYLSEVFPQFAGPLVAAAASAGLWITLRHPDKRKFLVLAFPLLFFAVIGAARLRWQHWIIPMMPFIGLYAAAMLDFLLQRLLAFARWEERKSFNLISLAIVSFFAIIFIIPPLKKSVALDRHFSLPDTRQACTQWIRQHIPGGKIAQEHYTFQPYPRHAYLLGEFQFQEYTILQRFSLANKSLEEYRAAGYTHLIVSSWNYNRYLREPERYPAETQFYRALLAQTPVKTFEPADNVMAGPQIAIYATE